jgi:hypothetical protein
MLQKNNDKKVNTFSFNFIDLEDKSTNILILIKRKKI